MRSHRRIAERAILSLCVLALVAGVAHDLGVRAEREKIASSCVAQPGEQLVVTIQTRDGVMCQYASAPPRANWTRRKAS